MLDFSPIQGQLGGSMIDTPYLRHCFSVTPFGVLAYVDSSSVQASDTAAPNSLQESLSMVILPIAAPNFKNPMQGAIKSASFTEYGRLGA